MSELIKKATRQLSSTGILGSVQRMASLIRSLESLGCMVEHLISQGAEYVREQDIEEFTESIQCRKRPDACKN